MTLRVGLIVLLGICDLALFGKMMWGHGGIIEYCELKREYGQIRAHVDSLDAENMALSREIRLLQTDNKYTEKMVRQKLRYLRDNEIVYLFPEKNGAQNGDVSDDSKN